MNQFANAVAQPNVADVARRAKVAARLLATLPGKRRDAALKAVAYAIEEHKVEILIANQRDCHDAARAVEAGRMSRALFIKRSSIETWALREIGDQLCCQGHSRKVNDLP